jgi:hypothetical protein
MRPSSRRGDLGALTFAIALHATPVMNAIDQDDLHMPERAGAVAPFDLEMPTSPLAAEPPHCSWIAIPAPCAWRRSGEEASGLPWLD